MAKFDETVELHINTIESGISGTMILPHGTGKEIRVAIADDAILSEVEKGKINFDVLIATPAQMPKLAKVARVLGPRGLMPNPKNGTISDKPEEAAKKFQGGQMGFKTESKNPLIHLSVGKTSFEDTQLEENIKTAISAVKRSRIRKVTLKSTMSPGIRIQA
jgi:large subunit ribosomal protein L1